MRETYFYFEFTQEQLEELAEQSQAAQGGVSINFEAPAAYEGEVLEYDDGGADGSRTTNPTPVDQTPTDAGYIDQPVVFAVASSDGTEALSPESGILRIEQHPSMYGTPIRLVFKCELSNGSTPSESAIISSNPTLRFGVLEIEIAMNLLPSSTITQDALINYLSNLTYSGNYLLIPSIQSDSNAPLAFFGTIEQYNSANTAFQDLCLQETTLQTTAGNPDAQISSGLPYIEGQFEQGRLLTVSLIDVTDRDPNLGINYQWYREEYVNGVYQNTAISPFGDSSFYIVSSNDVGKNLTVAVTYIDNAGDAAQKNSPPVFIINNPPTADISISSESFRIGNLVTAEVGPVVDRNTVKTISNYRWQRSNVVPLVSNDVWNPDWTNISGADQLSYTITNADQGRRLRFAIDVTDYLDDVQTLTSEQSTVVNTSPAGTLDITGTPAPGNVLYATKNFTVPDVLIWNNVQKTYTWFRNGFEIANSTKVGTGIYTPINRYTVQTEDYGSQIHATISYIDDRGYEETVTATAVSIVGSVASGFEISGVNEVSGTLSADFSNFSDPDLPETFDVDGTFVPVGKPKPSEVLYKWKIVNGSDITPESNEFNSILVSGSYYGETVRLEIRYPDPLNEGVYKAANAETTIVNSNPTGEILLTGSVVGVNLPVTLSVDQVQDINGPYGSENSGWPFNYSFTVRKRNDFGNLLTAVAATGANSSGVMTGNDTVVYQIPAEYHNSVLIANVSYSDRESVTHELTDSISIPEVGYPTVDGILEQQQQLSINLSEVENYQSTQSIKWYRYDGANFNEIAGATSENYTVTSEDVEKYLKVELVYTTNAADTETRSSVPFLISNSSPVGIPLIENSGSNHAQGFAVGEVLSSSVQHITDANGVQSLFDYQWYRQTNGHAYTTKTYHEDKVNLTDIENATNPTYTIQEEDQTRRIGFKVKLLDNLDKVHELDSGLSWRRVDYEANGFARVARYSDGNVSSAGIGEVLWADLSQILDLDGISRTYTTTWYVNGQQVQSSTSKYYTVSPDDYQKQIMAKVDYLDRQNGDSRSFTSTNVFTISDTPASGLYLQGEAIPGNTLTGITAHIDDPDGFPGENNATFQWYKNNLPISGETSKNYTVLRSDYNSTLKLEMSYTDNNGNAETLEASVLVGQSTPSGQVQLSGDNYSGGTITIGVDSITDPYGPETEAEKNSTEFTFALTKTNQNLFSTTIHQGTLFGNETDTYTIQDSDEGTTITAEATFIDGNGNQKEVSSNSIIIPVPPENSDDSGGGGEEPVIIDPDSTYQGSVTAQGAGLKTVKLLSNNYVITYDSNGYNPDIENFTITATAYNHVAPIFYKFYRLTSDTDVELPQGPNDTATTRIIDSSFNYVQQNTFRVDTYEESTDTTIIASDLVIIYGIKE